MVDTYTLDLDRARSRWSPAKRFVIVVFAGVIVLCAPFCVTLANARVELARQYQALRKDVAEFSLPAKPKVVAYRTAGVRVDGLLDQCCKEFRGVEWRTSERQRPRPRRVSNAAQASGEPTPDPFSDQGYLNDNTADAPSSVGAIPFVEPAPLPTPQRPLDTFVMQRSRQLLALNEQSLACLHEAAGLSESVNLTRWLGYAPYRAFVGSLLLKSVVDTADGKHASACDALRDALFLTRPYWASVPSQRRIETYRCLASALQVVLADGEPGDAQLSALDAALDALVDPEGVTRSGLQTLLSSPILLGPDHLENETYPGSRSRRAHNPYDAARRLDWCRALVDALRTNTLREMLAASAFASASAFPPVTEEAAGLRWVIETADGDARFVALARTAIAVQRYRLAKGVVPDTLDALVPAYCAELPRDPVSREPLRYERDAVKGTVVVTASGAGQGNEPIRLEVRQHPVAAKES